MAKRLTKEEVFKRSPAIQVASTILGNMGKRETEPTLADKFMAATHTLPKNLGLTAKETKLVMPALMRYRVNMRDAHRFVLSDDYTMLATQVASHLQPPKLLARLQYATLPYETTWIEFNLRLKVKVMRRLHGMDDAGFDYHGVAETLGLLIHRLNDKGDALCEVVVALDDMTTPSMLAYFFSTREHQFTKADGHKYDCSPFGSYDFIAELQKGSDAHSKRMTEISHKMGKGALWGYGNTPGHGMVLTSKDLDTLHVPEYLERHGDTAYSGVFMPYSRLSQSRGPDKTKKLVGILEREVVEFTGMMRFVVTVLTMLNEIPVHTSRVQPTGMMRYGLTNRRQFLDYHHVTIKLPKTDPIKYVDRHFRQSAKHRAHEVRSHWRTYMGDVHCRPDDHAWEYDPNDGYRLCGKCMAFSRLIPEHVRGDESLGWVRKDYTIKT